MNRIVFDIDSFAKSEAETYCEYLPTTRLSAERSIKKILRALLDGMENGDEEILSAQLNEGGFREAILVKVGPKEFTLKPVKRPQHRRVQVHRRSN